MGLMLNYTNGGNNKIARAISDNDTTLGSASHRFQQLFAGTSTINTSDIREKQQIRGISEAERAVAVMLKGMLRAFKWSEAVERKGDAARWHFGVMAQEVRDVFAEHGLDAHEYALFCYDEWSESPEVRDPETEEVIQPFRPAGNRYGVRYDQLLAFVLSAI
jgi:hypothetical protein